MKRITVGQFLNSFENPYSAVTVNKKDPLQSVMTVMLRHHEQRSVFVVDDAGSLSGVISVGELTRHLLHEGVAPHKGFSPSSAILHYMTAENAGDIMDRNVHYCTLDEPLEEAVKKMIGKKIYKSLPVVDEAHRIVDLLSILSVLEFGLNAE